MIRRRVSCVVRRVREGVVRQCEKGKPRRVVIAGERGCVVQHAEQDVEVRWRCAAQCVGMRKHQHVSPGWQPAEVAQAIGQGVPVVSECGWQCQRRRHAPQQLVLVFAISKVGATYVQLVGVGASGESFEIGNADKKHAVLCRPGQIGLKRVRAHGLSRMRRKLR